MAKSLADSHIIMMRSLMDSFFKTSPLKSSQVWARFAVYLHISHTTLVGRDVLAGSLVHSYFSVRTFVHLCVGTTVIVDHVAGVRVMENYLATRLTEIKECMQQTRDDFNFFGFNLSKNKKPVSNKIVFIVFSYVIIILNMLIGL